MQKYLFLFTIGPVQSFIAQARKTQDLYAGSQLLADLIHCGLGYIKANGNQLIYPSYEETDSGFSMNITQNNNSYPNRIVAIIEQSNNEKLIDFGNSLENVIRNCFKTTACLYFKEILKQNYDENQMLHQIDDLLEMYWVAVPYKSEKYIACFEALETKLATVKNFRQIKQLSDDEIGRKCNVDGQYNVKVYRKSEEEVSNLRSKKLFNNKNYIIRDKDILFRHIQPGEGLSAISFFKRLYRYKKQESQTFPSTAAIALMNIYNNEATKSLLEDYQQLFTPESYDEQLLFEDNLTSNYFTKYAIYAAEGNQQKHLIKEAKKQLEIIKQAAKTKNEPYSKYYALLRFDGDSMGKWLKKADTQEKHSKFSTLLIDFAKKATYVLDGNNASNSKNKTKVDWVSETNRGRTIYAGGDDFLGFVNLNYLFETICILRKLFEEEVSFKAQELFGTTDEFTFSTGIVIAHYKTPLKEVVKKSKELEDNAKKYRKDDGKKANTGICFMTSSTLLAEACFKNEDWLTLELLTNHLLNKELSKKFIFSFTREMQPLTGKWSHGEYQTLIAAQKVELARLINRATTPEFRNSSQINKLIKSLQDLLLTNAKQESSNIYIIDNDNFANFLKIAEKLASKLEKDD
jgi:CRISPR-associated protein Cmr2